VNRGPTVVACAMVVASVGWLGWDGLRGNLVYYETPSELLGADHVGERARLGGYVIDGSVRRVPQGLRFVVGDGTATVAVLVTAGVPDSFRDGRGVVVEGALDASGVFVADTVLVRHDDRYQPPAPAGVSG
jgi:cytochrome c-type biogenesis protein CcmE